MVLNKSSNTIKVSFTKRSVWERKRQTVVRVQDESIEKSSKNFINVMNRESCSHCITYWKTTSENFFEWKFSFIASIIERNIIKFKWLHRFSLSCANILHLEYSAMKSHQQGKTYNGGFQHKTEVNKFEVTFH